MTNNFNIIQIPINNLNPLRLDFGKCIIWQMMIGKRAIRVVKCRSKICLCSKIVGLRKKKHTFHSHMGY